jgi:hypothetical protein
MESTIPTDMTVADWRRMAARRRARRRSSRGASEAGEVVTLRPRPCDHIHEQTSRYDPVEKQLAFLQFCPVCRIEKVVDVQRYEPRFEPHAPAPSAGASVHRLPVRRHEEPAPRAA